MTKALGLDMGELSEPQPGIYYYNIRLGNHLITFESFDHMHMRKKKKEKKEKKMINMLKKLNLWSNKPNLVYHDNNNRFICCYSFYDKIVNKFYVTDIIIIDDTSYTNYYKKPLIVTIYIKSFPLQSLIQEQNLALFIYLMNSNYKLDQDESLFVIKTKSKRFFRMLK